MRDGLTVRGQDGDPKEEPAADASFWCLALGCALVLATAAFAVPGYLTWDSGTYHLMVKSFFDTGGFFIQNAFSELPSPLLEVGQVAQINGRLVSQYPEFYTLLAQPFFALFDYRGLMVLNALAFVGVGALIWRMAPWFSDDERAPLAAVGIYALATFALPYTQYSYPHITSTFFVCASAWLLWGAALGKDDLSRLAPKWLARGEGRFALAGLMFGIAIGIRLDSVFAGLALAVPVVAIRDVGWRAIWACGLGARPAFAGTAWINAVKFGVPLPFSYGPAAGGNTSAASLYLPVAAVFAGGLGLLIWHRVRPVRPRPVHVAVGLAALAVLLAGTTIGQRLAHGVFQIVVDLRIRPDIAEAALSRTPDGAMVYWGQVKKSLIESCPYLVLIVFPALRGLARGTYGINWLLWLVPAGFITVFGYFAWHGSIGWSMRYLNPALPFLAILASHELLRLKDRIPTGRPLFWIGVILLWGALAVLFFKSIGNLPRQELLFLDGALLLAALLLAAQIGAWAGSPDLSRVLSKALAALLVFSLVWSSAGVFSIDFGVAGIIRAKSLKIARAIEPHIEDGSLVLTNQIDGVWALLSSGKRPVLANYRLGSAPNAISLAERALANRPVYWVGPAPDDFTIGPAVHEALRARNVAVTPVPLGPGAPPMRLFKFSRGDAP